MPAIFMPGMKPISFLLLKLLLSLGLSVAPPFIAGDDHQFSYSGFSNTNLTIDGAASVTPNGLLMLTNGTSRSMGRAFHPDPLRFHNSSNGAVQSFSVSFVFAMVSLYKDLSSNGIAMFIAPSKNLSSAMRMQYLGLLSNQNDGNQTNHIFAVELDTFQNWELQDMNDNHIGIDINSLRSIQSHEAGFYHDKNGTFQSLSLDSQEVMQVWVDYHGENMQIDATMAPLGMAKPARPIVSATYNLSTVLTDVAYIGFSSAEGKITKHYVLGWSFGMKSPAPAINLTMLPKLPSGPRTKDRHRLRVLEIILPLATAALILSVAVIVSPLIRRHLRYAELREDWEVEFGPHRFSYKDLFRATEGFDNKNLLGAGGFGRVYRGELTRSKLRIAVKRVSHDSRQGMKEFIAEIVSLGRLQNPNLVHLLGYCRRQGELLLVYEYMPKGSLDKYLYGEVDNGSTLSWDQKFWIIRGIASALVYLHEEWEKVVVHRDIKASNVLLDNEFNGRLGDFGLARLYDHGVEQETTRVVGTIGYLAPELARTGKGTPLTDVFAFGVFVLEVACGQRPIMQSTEDKQVMLVDWVLEHLQQGSIADAIDVRLKGQYNDREAYLALKLGLLCSHPFASARPSMRQVIQYLDGHIEPPELPTHQSFQALALMRNEGFDSYVMSYPSSKSAGTISSISGGR